MRSTFIAFFLLDVRQRKATHLKPEVMEAHRSAYITDDMILPCIAGKKQKARRKRAFG